ncbi:Autophagy protein 7 [Chytriomyces hyalinus]|nr:Autophagy protein 7 [Chytriomyces hyalinus]
MSNFQAQKLIQFAPLSSAVDANFWHSLSQRKMDLLRLDASLISISATVQTPNNLCVDGDSFDSKPTTFSASSGTLLNTNTVEDFKNRDKNAFIKAAAEKLWVDITSGEALTNHALLACFTLLTFADLKKYKFYYWFAFPALLPPEHFTGTISELKDVWSQPFITRLQNAIENTRSASQLPDTMFLLVKKGDSDSVIVGKLSEWETFWEGVDEAERTVVFSDPSNLPSNPGWALRNFLILAKHRFKTLSLNVICFRDMLQGKRDASTSLFVRMNLPGTLGDECPKFVGWEKNSSGKLSPRLVDLAPMMDPTRLAETAVDLNLKLMRWRIMPQLQLEKISETKCLLLGSGTLGCYVARNLMAWGVRKITLVDSGTVSYSNPVRQPLFTFQDSVAGKPKAAAAADALKAIYPGIQAEGIQFSIPMPGHASPSLEATDRDLTQLTDLISSHDAIFLLTDSREARWLPTVIGAALGKIVINTALGFDTFLVMRHGVRSGNVPPAAASIAADKQGLHGGEMGCYYCNDVVAPADSLSDRTLDQQCTVTRPGLSLVASGLAVELMVSLLNHPDGIWAPSETGLNPTDPTAHPLGVVPHQIRGYLTHFSNLLVHGKAYDKCTACSAAVLKAYRERGAEFVHAVLADPKVLEDLTGLSAMHRETDDADVEWDEEDEEEDGSGF